MSDWIDYSNALASILPGSATFVIVLAFGADGGKISSLSSKCGWWGGSLGCLVHPRLAVL
jgi:hypothetical protein